MIEFIQKRLDAYSPGSPLEEEHALKEIVRRSRGCAQNLTHLVLDRPDDLLHEAVQCHANCPHLQLTLFVLAQHHLPRRLDKLFQARVEWRTRQRSHVGGAARKHGNT